MRKREGWKFPCDNEGGLDEVFESLYGSKKFKAIPVSLLNQMFQWKTAEWEDKEQKVKSFQDFVNTYKDEYNYFLIYEFNEGALRMKSLLEYHKLFKSVNVNPNRVIFLTSNWNFSYFYDELEFAITGKLYGEKYQLGRSVRIRVRSVSLEKRRADFDLVD